MIDNQVQNEIGQFEYRLRMQGLDMDKYIEATNTSVEDLEEQVRPIADKKVRADLVLEKIGKIEELEITDKDMDGELEKLAIEYNQEDVEKFKEDMKKGDLEYIKSGIIRDKTIELLVKNTKFI